MPDSLARIDVANVSPESIARINDLNVWPESILDSVA